MSSPSSGSQLWTNRRVVRVPVCQRAQPDVSKHTADPNEDSPINHLCMSKTKTSILPGRESESQRNLLLPENFRCSKNTGRREMKLSSSAAVETKQSNSAWGHDPDSALLSSHRQSLSASNLNVRTTHTYIWIFLLDISQAFSPPKWLRSMLSFSPASLSCN